MKTLSVGKPILAVLLALALSSPAPAATDEQYEAIKAQVEALQQQLQQVQEPLRQFEQNAADKQEVSELRESVAQTIGNEEIQELKSQIAEAAAWKSPNTLIHM